MTKKIQLLVFLLFFLSVATDAKEKVTVAIDPNYAPFTYKSFEAKPEGFLVDFWRLWSQKSGYEVEFKFYNWDDSLKAVQNSEVIYHSGLDPDADWMVPSKKIYEVTTSFYKLKNAI